MKLLIAAVMLLASMQSRKPDRPKTGPLAGLPSPLGDHAARARGLGEGQWLDLGAPAPDPKWGKAPGRSYTPKMAYAADLRVAFLYGEGVHGFVKENGHYMNDFWAYDIPAHRWICIDPGVDTKNFFVKVNEDGFEVDRSGHVLPVAQLVHGYEQTAYDPDLRKFLFMPSPSGYWRTRGLAEARPHVAKEAWNWNNKNASPWMYDIATARWELRKVPGESRRSGAGDAIFYLPSVRKTYHWRGDGVGVYDYATNTWKPLSPKGPRANLYDPVACHDTKRDRVYFFTDRLSIFDVATGAWIDPGAASTLPAGKVRLASWTGHMTYDSVNDGVVVIAHYPDFGAARGLYVYDPSTNSWTAQPKPLPAGRWGAGTASNGFYDPEQNLHYYHLARDSRDDGTIWAYRHKLGKERR